MGSYSSLTHFISLTIINHKQKTCIMLSQNQESQVQESKNLLSQALQRYHYYGLLEEYQLHSNLIANGFQYNKLNSYQHFLFKRVLHGLNVYSTEEVEKLHWDKKRRITKVWKRSQKEINAWKQMICNKKANDYFKNTFKSCSIIEYILSVPVTEVLDDYNNKLTFKDLDITYEDVILLFMSKGLLPKNYLILKPNAQQQSLKAC